MGLRTGVILFDMSGWILDLKSGLRALADGTGWSLAITLILALGVGVGSAIFAMADPFLRRGSPYPDAAQIVVLRAQPHVKPANDSSRPVAPQPTFEDLRTRHELFAEVGAIGRHVRIRANLPHGTRILQGVQVSQNLPSLLGERSLDMSVWGVANEAETPVALMSVADASVITGNVSTTGQSIPTWDGPLIRVAGSLRPTFKLPNAEPNYRIDVLVAFAPQSVDRISVIARLQPGVTHIDVAKALGRLFPARTFTVQSLHDYLTSDIRPVALGAIAAVCLLLVICCANLTNLVLTRVAFRRDEMVARRALGATRRDLWRLLAITYSALLLIGIACGLITATSVLALAARVIPDDYTFLGPPSMSWRVIGFSIAASIVVMGLDVLVAGLRTLPREQPRPDGLGWSNRPQWKLRRGLLFTQTSVTMVLMIGAGLLVRSYIGLVTQNLGLAHTTVAASVSPLPGRSAVESREAREEVLNRFRTLPRVAAAAAGIGALVDEVMAVGSVDVSGQSQRVSIKFVTGDYFATLKIPVVLGRPLAAEDRTQSVISERLARDLWPEGGWIGRSVTVTGRGGFDSEVVGIARDAFDYALDVKPGRTIYRPIDAEGAPFGSPFHYVIDIPGRPRDVQQLVRHEIESVGRGQAVTAVSTVGERLANSVRAKTFATFIGTSFAVTSLVICLSGVTAVVASTVTRRKRELAIRMALGATTAKLRALVLKEVLILAFLGVASGSLLGVWLSRSLSSFLYAITPADPMAIAVAMVVMGVAVVISAWWPSARTIHLAPAAILKAD